MAINVGDLLSEMAVVAEHAFAQKWPEIREFAQTELKGIAESIALIERLNLAGQISEEQAKLLLQMKKNTATIVLLTLEGLGIIAVEAAINAALGVIKDTVNEALDFALL